MSLHKKLRKIIGECLSYTNFSKKQLFWKNKLMTSIRSFKKFHSIFLITFLKAQCKTNSTKKIILTEIFLIFYGCLVIYIFLILQETQGHWIIGSLGALILILNNQLASNCQLFLLNNIFLNIKIS